MAEVYSIGAAALAAGKELGATIESAAEKRDKAFQDFDVKYNLTSTMEETVSDTLQPVYRQAAQAALNEAQEAATALEADPNNADLRARVRAAQRQYDEIKNIGVARTAQDNKTRQMIRNGEIEDMAGSIEENLAKMDEMSSMSGKTIAMEGGTVMITNPDGSKTPMLGSAYGDVQGVFTPAVMSPASKYNPSLVGTKMNYKKYKLTDGDGTIGMDMDSLRAGFAEDLDVIRRANPDAYRTAVAQNYLVQIEGRTDISKQALDAEVARIEPLIESTTFTIDGKQVAATTYSLDDDGKVVYDLTDTDIENLFGKKQIYKDDFDALMHYRKANSMYIEDTYAAEANSIDLTDEIQQRDRNKLVRSRSLYDTEQAYERALAKEEAKSNNLPNLNFTPNEDGTHTITGLTRTKVMVTEDLAENIPALRDKFGATRGEQLSVVGGTLNDNTRKFTSIVITPADRSHNGGKDIEVDAEYIARAMAERKNESDFTPYMGEAREDLYRLGAAVNNTSSTLAKGQPLDLIEETFSVSRGNPPSPGGSGGGALEDLGPDPVQPNPTRE